MSSIPDDLKSAIQHYRTGNLEEAHRLLLAYCGRYPGNVQVLRMLSQICYQTGRIAESIAHLEQARAVSPGDSDIRFSLGALYAEQRDMAAAITHYRESLRLAPNNVEGWSNLGVVYYRMQQYGASIECLSRAVAINDKNEKALYNLGLSLIAAGRVVEADRMFRAARVIAPENEAINSVLLYNLNNLQALTSREIFAEHRQWGSRFDGLTQAVNAQPRSPRGNRKIRVGYLSPDFKRHSVFYFIASILRAHDRSVVECFGYADVLQPDDATLHLKSLADHWRDVSRLNNEQVLQLIRDDAIDILVDLAGHTANNRLPVFAVRAAAVQVSWIGYPGSTGLRKMDYRLTDALADPAGESDALHMETLVRLEGGFLCYEPPVNSPSPGKPPALANGFVTFGSFNNLSKVTDDVIRVWSDILRRIPPSRMILKAKGLGDAGNRDRILSVFQGCGIVTQRIECLGFIGGVDNHLDQYNRIDIALDTFPYNGTTTTCEALWMGVPVITLAGDRHVSRVGKSLLTTVGLGELITDNPNAYIECALALAANIERLKDLRAQMRDKLRTSPLMDAPEFTRILERHYVRFMDKLESA